MRTVRRVVCPSSLVHCRHQRELSILDPPLSPISPHPRPSTSNEVRCTTFHTSILHTYMLTSSHTSYTQTNTRRHSEGIHRGRSHAPLVSFPAGWDATDRKKQNYGPGVYRRHGSFRRKGRKANDDAALPQREAGSSPPVLTGVSASETFPMLLQLRLGETGLTGQALVSAHVGDATTHEGACWALEGRSRPRSGQLPEM